MIPAELLSASEVADELSDSFFSKGLHFECRRCSNCCRLTPGFVFLTVSDLKNLMKATGLSRADFSSAYCRLVNINGFKRVSLIEKNNYDCIFWANGGCTVYEHRPFQCRSFPFWRSKLSSAAAWEECKESCPGVGLGRIHSEDIIEGWLKKQRRVDFLEQ